MLKLFPKRSDSRDIAFERLNRAILKDRTNCSHEMIEGLGNDILSAISNYMEIDRAGADIHISRSEGEEKPVLYAKIPIITLFNEGKKNVYEKSALL